jgi:hypothetical protein
MNILEIDPTDQPRAFLLARFDVLNIVEACKTTFSYKYNTLNKYQVTITLVVLSHSRYSPGSNANRFAISFNIIVELANLQRVTATYHLLVCPLYFRSLCTTSFNDVTLRTKYG